MNDHGARAHSRFGASSAHRWMACPGTIRMCEGIPERSSAYADEGTQAHELLELRLTYHREKSSPAAEALVAAAQAASQDMTEAVNVAFDYVVDIMDAFPDAILEVEHKIEIPEHIRVRAEKTLRRMMDVSKDHPNAAIASY